MHERHRVIDRWHPLHIYGTVGPAAQLSLVSHHITCMYRIRRLHVHFPDGCAGLVLVRLLVCNDEEIFTTGIPPGESLLTSFSPDDFLAANNHTLTLQVDIPIWRKGTWIKAHVTNTDAFPHTVSVLISLSEIEEPH